MSPTERLAQWKRDFPLPDRLLTEGEINQAMTCRSNWILAHPDHNDIARWTRGEVDYFVAVGRLIQESYDRLHPAG